MVASAQGSPKKREADEWAKLAVEEPDTRGMAWLLLGLDSRTRDAASQRPIPRTPRVGGHREEVGGGSVVDWRPDLQEEIQDTEQADLSPTARLRVAARGSPQGY